MRSCTLALLLITVHGQLRDEEYQKYAEKLYDEKDTAALNRGKAIACGLCNLALMAIKGQYTMHREGTLGRKFSEEEGMQRLEKICHKLAPSMAKRMLGRRRFCSSTAWIEGFLTLWRSSR